MPQNVYIFSATPGKILVKVVSNGWFFEVVLGYEISSFIPQLVWIKHGSSVDGRFLARHSHACALNSLWAVQVAELAALTENTTALCTFGAITSAESP